MNIEVLAAESGFIGHSGYIVVFVQKKEKKNYPCLIHLKKSFKFHASSEFIYINTTNIKKSDEWRQLGFDLIKYTRTIKNKDIMVETIKHLSPFVEGLVLGSYSDDMKSKPEKIKNHKFYIETDEQEDIDIAIGDAEAQCLCREMVNGTPFEFTSEFIYDTVNLDFLESNIKVTAFHEADLGRLGMAGHLAVNRASPNEAMTIKLEYSPESYYKHIVLVGKGLTYDSGGLSIKVGAGMQTMKCDKAGGMAVYGIMKGLIRGDLGVKVTAYMCMAENVIDGNAYKPGEVLTMKNGKTVQVKNTDAEGRIVLFDNLCLAEEENPEADEIYTLATLTGASVAMYGDEAGVMVGTNKTMKKAIRKAGKAAGEIFCDAEIHKYMLKGIEDDFADLSNMGTPNSGCQKAGLFLAQALSKNMQKKYLHLDIAGASFASKPFGTNITGGTGFGVRTILNLLK